MKKKIIIILIILFSLVGVFGYFYSGRNIYSKDILKLEILGPQEANAFDEINYTVKFKNNGNFRLEDPKLIFEYPQDSIVEGSLVKEIKIDDIYPGEERTISFKGKLIGKIGDVKTAKAKLIFRPKELKSFYESSTTFSTVIKKSSLSFDFDIPDKAEAGKDIQLDINYFSNIDYPVLELGVFLDYPDGFNFENSDPHTLDPKQFDIGTLNKAEGGRIRINGKISGDVGQEKIFEAKLGIWENGKFVVLKEIARSVEIISPSLYIFQEINNNPQYIASPGDSLHYVISFKNIGEEAQKDLFLIVKLEGKAFDFETIKSLQGDFEPGDNSIVFDWRKIPELQYLGPQEESQVEFWVKLKDDWGYTKDDKNPVIRTRIYVSQLRKEFETKVNSKLTVVQKAYFQDEVFGNEGPLPPQVGKSTSYTISWQVKNYYNKVKNVKVKSVLPRNVELTGKIFPEEQASSITFDPKSREVIWNVGDLSPGILENGPNISFQVKFTPTQDQRGKTPEIIGEAEISGEDQFTGAEIKSRTDSLNTTLPDDDTINESQGVVQ